MKNKFLLAGCECTCFSDEFRVYKIDNIEQARATTNTTCWCLSTPENFNTSHTQHKYVVVKILSNGMSKIIAGVDLGFGLIRMPNNEVITAERIKPIAHIIDHMFTDEILAGLVPKGTDGYIFPDIWTHRNVSSRINSALLKNSRVVESVYVSKYNK